MRLLDYLNQIKIAIRIVIEPEGLRGRHRLVSGGFGGGNNGQNKF